MKQNKLYDLVLLLNGKYHDQYFEPKFKPFDLIVAENPSLSPYLFPIRDLVLLSEFADDVRHKIAIRSILTCQIFELAGADVEAAEDVINLIKCPDLKIQLNAAKSCAIAWFSRAPTELEF